MAPMPCGGIVFMMNDRRDSIHLWWLVAGSLGVFTNDGGSKLKIKAVFWILKKKMFDSKLSGNEVY